MYRACTAIIAALLLPAPAVSAQEAVAKSPDLVKQLTQLMDSRKLDSVAAPDPKNQGTYAAALYFPGSQLLVVSAKYAAPVLLDDKIAKKDYRDVYIDLNAASVAGSKIFVMDAACDGLVAKPGDGAADTWEQGTTNRVFDGDFKKAKMSEDEYGKAFAAADEKYAQILSLLTAQAAKGGS